MQAVGILIGVLGLCATILVWLFPEQRDAVLSWIGLSSRPSTLASEPADLLVPESEPEHTEPKASDFINLGEHLWYLSNSIYQPTENITASISSFTKRLDKCGFPATHAAARCMEATTVGQLQSQMVAISSSLYSEATAKQTSFIKLGEFLWYLSNPKTATTNALESGINGFLKILEACNLKTRETAKPLERFHYVYFQNDNMVLGKSLEKLASIMQPIRLHLEHETQDMSLDE